jgi:hypothetical protein
MDDLDYDEDLTFEEIMEILEEQLILGIEDVVSLDFNE